MGQIDEERQRSHKPECPACGEKILTLGSHVCLRCQFPDLSDEKISRVFHTYNMVVRAGGNGSEFLGLCSEMLHDWPLRLRRDRGLAVREIRRHYCLLSGPDWDPETESRPIDLQDAVFDFCNDRGRETPGESYDTACHFAATLLGHTGGARSRGLERALMREDEYLEWQNSEEGTPGDGEPSSDEEDDEHTGRKA